MLIFNKKYFLLTLILFVIEVFIAAFVRDKFIRPHFGDFLVVLLIYCFVKSFIKIRFEYAAAIVLLFSYFIEWTQYLELIEKIGLQHSSLAKAVLGNSFSWLDVLFYTLGILVVILLETFSSKTANR